MHTVKKILVIRLSSLGDIILSFPLLKKLKEKFPDSKIDYVTKMNYRDILLLNPNIDNIILLSGKLSEARKLIHNESYDLIADLQNNVTSFYLSFLNGKKITRYIKNNFKKLLLVKFKINLFKKIIPVYKKYLNTVREYLSSNDFDFTTTELKFDKTRFIPDDYIVISPSSRHFTKTYPADKFVTFIKSSAAAQVNNYKIVLSGDNSEKDIAICKYIQSKCNNIINLCGELKIEQLASLLYHCKFVICNDSAILHFAEALDKKVICIFGSTVKEFGFFPQRKMSEVREITNLKCRPCTHIGREHCPLGHFRCMNDIELSNVKW